MRDIALRGFGVHNLRPGTPLALLEDVLAPLYFHHRYQLQAAIKVVGGVEYDYAVHGGGGETPARPIDDVRQRRALAAVTGLLAPAKLDLPEPVLAHLLPRPPQYEDRRETFSSGTAPVFDALGAAATAADMVVRGLLAPERAARLVDQHRRDARLPALEEVLDALVKIAFAAPPGETKRLAEVRRSVQQVVTLGLLDIAADNRATTAVRARTERRLLRLRADLRRAGAGDEAEVAHREFLVGEITRWLGRAREAPPTAAPAPRPPPGDPIGCSFAASR